MEIPYTVTARKDTGLFNSKIGIWLFLASEVMLFGGLFSGYVFLRIYADYPWPERALPVLPGLINTFVLIGSSVTVVFAWAALKMRQWRRFQIFMGITILCAGIFMVLKAIEYKAKWEHQAIRMDDFTVIEGHTHKAHLKDGKLEMVHHGDGHGGDSHDKGHGDEFYANKLIFQTESLAFSLVRAHESWVQIILDQAAGQHSEVVTADHAFFYGHLEDFPTDEAARQAAEEKLISDHAGDGTKTFHAFGKNSLYIAKGTPLNYGLLERAREIFLDGRSHNAKVRTEELRELWKVAHRENPGVPNWKLAPDVKMDPARLKEIEILVQPSLEFAMEPAAPLVLKRNWIKKKPVPAGATETALKDDTTLKGALQDSPILLAVDAIDFRHVAQKAREANKDPETVIENLWLFSDENKHAEEYRAIWKKHQEHIEKLKEELAKRDRVPTDTDLYRVTWKDLVEYESGKRPTMTQGFAGPNHKNEEFAKAFPELEVPHEKVFLESKFTPKWNTYYAVYFTLTGLHGLHVIGGAIVLGYYLFFSKGLYRRNPEWLANRVEVGGLFWHFVDLVWIFLFPILYLM